ncbi:MAG: hypothetical protein A3F40_02090 [Chlamydiae bacterium RIFCSPHIGHO2_12_FULL_27_8]|nr:MAG: hypothetical protein A3F40_02090 [Chlamydiae bacterium RIFCSPHIGHO2_12_FULL_27_8]OGN65851.1 MAG: hypothetical protein A2888_03355 [Chlamydiae bacterium RIFCSPLOWO2_01_FULL_28_7]
MSDKFKNVLIGFFALLGIVITIGIIMFLKPSIGDGKKTLNVRFANIQGVHIGTRVLFAGKAVGDVIDIATIQNARNIQKDEYGRLFFYHLKLKVDSSVEVYDTDIISIQTVGLVGEKSINITPLVVKDNKDPRIINNEIIYAKSVDSFESTAEQISALADKAEVAISTITNLMNNVKDTNLLNKIDLLVDNLSLTSSYFSQDGKIILNNIKNFTENTLNDKNSFTKLFNDEGLYLKLNAILSKTNTLMNDVNNYGVLFHYNKKWQRQREKKANIMYGLRSSKEFKSYFDTELSEITTSIARINQLIENSKQKNVNFTSSDEFKKDFYYLLKQTEALLDNIKLCNEDLNESTIHE